MNGHYYMVMRRQLVDLVHQPKIWSQNMHHILTLQYTSASMYYWDTMGNGKRLGVRKGKFANATVVDNHPLPTNPEPTTYPTKHNSM